MKITVLGGGSVRTPLLVRGLLLQQDLPLQKITLFDTDQSRATNIMRVVDRVAEHFGGGTEIGTADSIESALESADYIFSSFRQGGDFARVLDEKVPLAMGELGQETVGPGGFSMAMRSIPPSLRYADLAFRVCPEAWYINFTNPSGILTQALLDHSRNPRVVGICDAPVAIQRIAATIYGVPAVDVAIRYFGLNHLGWVTSVKIGGEEKIADLTGDMAEAFASYEPLYSSLIPHMRRYGIIPNEYLLFYLFRDDIVEKLKVSGTTRGEGIARDNAELFRRLTDPDLDPVAAYEAYLAGREAGYMATESGNVREKKDFSLFEKGISFGYDDVAIMIMRALSGNGATELPVNVRNGGFCSWLEAADVIEVSCRIDRNGLSPVPFDPRLPEDLASLVRSAKAYERMTSEAAVTFDLRMARKALSMNPLLAHPAKADELLNRILEAQGDRIILR